MILAMVWPWASPASRVRRIIMSSVPFSISSSDLGFSGTDARSFRSSKEGKHTLLEVLREGAARIALRHDERLVIVLRTNATLPGRSVLRWRRERWNGNDRFAEVSCSR